MSFATILGGLRENEIRFVVVGGLAGIAHGSRRVTDDVDICYDVSGRNTEHLAALLSKWNAYPRGIEPNLPFFMDARQFSMTPIMTLTTSEGFIDVLDVVKGVGDYSECRRRSVEIEAFDISFRVLDLSALIDAKAATGRPKDIDQLPELEALLALRGRTRIDTQGWR
jgi:predicted nucleotidyltransferase